MQLGIAPLLSREVKPLILLLTKFMAPYVISSQALVIYMVLYVI